MVAGPRASRDAAWRRSRAASPELDDQPVAAPLADDTDAGPVGHLELTVLAVVFATVTVVFGIIPSSMFHL